MKRIAYLTVLAPYQGTFKIKSSMVTGNTVSIGGLVGNATKETILNLGKVLTSQPK